MSITYREGNEGRLSVEEMDNNFHYIEDQIIGLSASLSTLEPTVAKYKVFTALLDQSGDNVSLFTLSSDNLTPGVTYLISVNNGGADFTMVGAPNNDEGTYFLATGTTPDWGTNGANINTSSVKIDFIGAAPVAAVLENTIGNIWFIYSGIGSYTINSDGLFTLLKTTFSIQQNNASGAGGNGNYLFYQISQGNNENIASINTIDVNLVTGESPNINGALIQTLVEIRVYN